MYWLPYKNNMYIKLYSNSGELVVDGDFDPSLVSEFLIKENHWLNPLKHYKSQKMVVKEGMWKLYYGKV